MVHSQRFGNYSIQIERKPKQQQNIETTKLSRLPWHDDKFESEKKSLYWAFEDIKMGNTNCNAQCVWRKARVDE